MKVRRELDWKRPLAAILVLEPAGADCFRARLGGFGGETLGCLALAAARTCPERPLTALHTWFLRPVPPGEPVELAVERVRDGRRLAHRRVSMAHGGRLLCEATARFAAPGEGPAYRDAPPAAPPPEELASEEEVARAEGQDPDQPGPFGGPLEWRWVGVPWHVDGPDPTSRYLGWVRPRHPLPDEPALRPAALAYLSDYHSHMSVARRLGAHFDPMGFASLDQILWIHRDRPWDDWWLMVTESRVAWGGRALTHRSLHTRDGEPVASMAQEALLPPGAGAGAG